MFSIAKVVVPLIHARELPSTNFERIIMVTQKQVKRELRPLVSWTVTGAAASGRRYYRFLSTGREYSPYGTQLDAGTRSGYASHR